jgi:lipoprotein-anchoring transpeptidase ErfK/SrfK
MYNFTRLKTVTAVATIVAATAIFTSAASANPFNPFEALFGPHREPVPAPAYANPQEDANDLRGDLQRQIVNYRTSEAPGTIIIDTPNTYLYLVMGGGKAMRYGIGVGREGFTWSGMKTIERKAEWPDWTPPPEMIQR